MAFYAPLVSCENIPNVCQEFSATDNENDFFVNNWDKWFKNFKYRLMAKVVNSYLGLRLGCGTGTMVGHWKGLRNRLKREFL